MTYNRPRLLKECVKALLTQEKYACDVIIVDNDSDEETWHTVDSLIADSDRIIYHRLARNIGGAGGFAYGIEKAFQQGYDPFWLMDDDVIQRPDALDTLMYAHIALGGPDGYGFLSGRTVWTDGKLCLMNRQRCGFNTYVSEESLKRSEFIGIDQATFVSLLLPRETVVKVGLPYKEYFIWGDDIEYTRRIAVRNKLRAYLVRDSVCVHKMKDNTGSSIADDNEERIDRYYYAYRNENHLYRREPLMFIAYYLPKCFLNLLRIVFRASGYKGKRMGTLLKGFMDGFTFRPQLTFVPVQKDERS